MSLRPRSSRYSQTKQLALKCQLTIDAKVYIMSYIPGQKLSMGYAKRLLHSTACVSWNNIIIFVAICRYSSLSWQIRSSMIWSCSRCRHAYTIRIPHPEVDSTIRRNSRLSHISSRFSQIFVSHTFHARNWGCVIANDVSTALQVSPETTS